MIAAFADFNSEIIGRSFSTEYRQQIKDSNILGQWVEFLQGVPETLVSGVQRPKGKPLIELPLTAAGVPILPDPGVTAQGMKENEWLTCLLRSYLTYHYGTSIPLYTLHAQRTHAPDVSCSAGLGRRHH